MIRKAKAVIVGLTLLFSVGCGASLNATKVASGIEATKDLYRAACTHEPVNVPRNVCEDARDGINDVIDFYTEINDAL